MVDHFSADLPNFPLPDKIRLGATGVRLFLVLSGYFITASLRRARDRMDAGEVLAGQTLKAFYWRRLLRTGPAYVAFAGIALPNPGSIGLHEATGFTPVGIYREVGWKMDGWRDVGWWQRLL